MNNQPFISIIVPVYNGENIIGACLKSLLAQDYPKDKYEVIAVDNNSKDKTADIIKEYSVHYLFESKVQGSYAARNTGVRHAKGEILAFTDADCVADKGWLKKGIMGFVGGKIGCVAGSIKGYEPANYIEEYLIKREILSHKKESSGTVLPYAKTANAFYRKEVFDKIGLFEERWASGGDADLSWRMQLKTDYKILFKPDTVIFHKHRSTLCSLFQQCSTWGIGSTLLYKKYPDLMPKRTWRQTLWIIWRLLYVNIALLSFYAADKEKMDEAKRKRYLDYFTFFGWEWGKVVGSIRNQVFYI